MSGKKSKSSIKSTWLKFWRFIWEDNSIWSWLANIELAFILIKFVVYPVLGAVLSTSYPIVAVVSSSMEHNTDFESWWSDAGSWYTKNDITKDNFTAFELKNGFNKGDIMVLKGAEAKDIKIGDVIVFRSARVHPKRDPIIHRVVEVEEKNGNLVFHTKGDNPLTNKNPIDVCLPDGCIYESDIWEEQIIGKAVARVPYLGYVKIVFMSLINLMVR